MKHTTGPLLVGPGDPAFPGRMRCVCPSLWPRPLASAFSVKAESEGVRAGSRDRWQSAVRICECDRDTKREAIHPKRRHRSTAHSVATKTGHRAGPPDPNHVHRHGPPTGTLGTHVTSRPRPSAGCPQSCPPRSAPLGLGGPAPFMPTPEPSGTRTWPPSRTAPSQGLPQQVLNRISTNIQHIKTVKYITLGFAKYI